MLIMDLTVAVVSVALVATRPRSMPVALGVLALALMECGPSAMRPAVVAVGPAVAFLWAVMRLALLAERSGLAARLAALLLATGRGSAFRLFWWACGACALLTAALSLDGAVVVMAPVLLALRRHGLPRRPLLLGTVAVANAFSAALPAGNPTNLVVMNRLDLAPAAFVTRMGVPSALATLVCVFAVVLLERRALSSNYELVRRPELRLTREQRLPALLLAAAALADWLSPLFGASPWLPVTVIALLAGRGLSLGPLPLRVGAQVAGLLLVLEALPHPSLPAGSLLALIAVAGLTALLSGVANNLPAAAAVATAMGPGAAPYAALLGLSTGALVTPHGSVATIASLELANAPTPARWVRTWVPAVAAALAAGTALVWLGVP
jgi:arsenical pump membrane protein